jgi:hypothetical protein
MAQWWHAGAGGSYYNELRRNRRTFPIGIAEITRHRGLRRDDGNRMEGRRWLRLR